ncbi:protein kinase domain-containing protein [Phytohabitans houttuyneae]|uniref:non-specific serine/threonine protein kinase n=1 Tax=Phytohabitans houttuyneae TaxID=1076126 RepID=A0A6V8JZD0_9ACTN|nr:protein kinase [Phytohabitans houttuyneae]GFJ76644.1 hypothetical protein Phou_008240 [Phytohabitans houttuyneae]
MASSGHVVGGRYRLDSVLGSGGMGVVWRAFDERLARWVAVKELRLTQPMTPEEREEVKYRAMVEALSAGRLVHPNVVAIYDAVDDADQPWVVMRLVEGRSLREVVAQDGPSTRSPPPSSGWGCWTRWTRPTGPVWCTGTSSRQTC